MGKGRKTNKKLVAGGKENLKFLIFFGKDKKSGLLFFNNKPLPLAPNTQISISETIYKKCGGWIG
jgi:hypothetical protein